MFDEAITKQTPEENSTGIEYSQEMIKEIEKLENSPRIDPYTLRRYLESIPMENKKSIWEKTIHEIENKTLFLEEFEEANLVSGIINGSLISDIETQYQAQGQLSNEHPSPQIHGGYIVGQDKVLVGSKKPEVDDLITSVISRGNLPESLNTANHEILHRLQYKPLGNLTLNQKIRIFLRTRGLLDLDDELIESHSSLSTNLRHRKKSEAVEIISTAGMERGKVEDASGIVLGAKSIGISDTEIANAIESSSNWHLKNKKPDLITEDEVKNTSAKYKWPDNWSYYYLNLSNTKDSYLDLHKWLIDKCVTTNVESPQELQKKIGTDYITKRYNSLRAAFIAQETLYDWAHENITDIKFDPSLSIPDRENIYAKEPYFKLRETISKGLRQYEEDFEELRTGSGLTTNEFIYGKEVVKSSPDWLRKALIKTSAGSDTITKSVELMERYYNLAVSNYLLPELEAERNLSKSSSLLAALDISKTYELLNDQQNAERWKIISYNWCYEFLENPSFSTGIPNSSLKKTKEDIYKSIQER